MTLVLPALILGVLILGAVRKVDLLDAFAAGVKEGLATLRRIFPILLFILAAIAAFRVSGGMDLLAAFLAPVCDFLSIPSQLVPLILLRPLSGSGSLAMLEDILTRYGADSPLGRLASVLTASTETTLYTFSLYLGSVRKNTGRILFCALITDLVTVLLAVLFCRRLF